MEVQGSTIPLVSHQSVVVAPIIGIVAQAALDVYAEEPPPADSPLLHHPKVVCTPHLGASTSEAQEGVAVEIVEAVVNALRGELVPTAINAPMVPPEVLAELQPYVTLAQACAPGLLLRLLYSSSKLMQLSPTVIQPNLHLSSYSVGCSFVCICVLLEASLSTLDKLNAQNCQWPLLLV